MPIRPYAGVQTIGAASQPVFGTTLTAATVLTPDQFSQSTGPGSNPSVSKLTVTSTVGMKTGDRILIGPKGNFVPGGVLDGGTIQTITSSTVMTVDGLTKAHANGEYVVLNNDVAQVIIVPVVNTGKIYLGNASTVSSTDPSTYDVLPIFNGTGNPYFHQSLSGGQFDPFQLSEFWITASNGDTFIARFVEA